ncbi:MAG: hypothetical protein CMO29_23740 [Tistrella sp.]|nr:hypothetical protein [Tistrella sp.]
MLHLLGKLAIAGAIALSPAAAFAEWVPERPINIIVGFSAGGGTDATARLIASSAQEFFPVPLVVVNRPGASGTLAAELVADAEPDGLTLLVAGGSESTSVPNHLKTNYSLDELKGVIRVNREHMVIVTKADSGLESADDIVAAAKADPGGLSFGSSGPASILQSAFEVFSNEADIEMTHVPFKGGAPALAALLGGHIDMTILTPGDAAAQAEAGNVNIIATTSDRAPQLPDVPSLQELGYDVKLENMKGLVVPAGTPDEVVTYLHDHFKQAMDSDTFANLAKRANINPAYLNGADFDAAMNNMSDSIAGALNSQ